MPYVIRYKKDKIPDVPLDAIWTLVRFFDSTEEDVHGSHGFAVKTTVAGQKYGYFEEHFATLDAAKAAFKYMFKETL